MISEHSKENLRNNVFNLFNCKQFNFWIDSLSLFTVFKNIKSYYNVPTYRDFIQSKILSPVMHIPTTDSMFFQTIKMNIKFKRFVNRIRHFFAHLISLRKCFIKNVFLIDRLMCNFASILEKK